MSGGIFLALVGVWILVQVTKGDAIGRLDLV